MPDQSDGTVASGGGDFIETRNGDQVTASSSSPKDSSSSSNNDSSLNVVARRVALANPIRAAAVPGFPDATPPSQVTFEGDTASAETLSTTASSSLSLAPTHRSPPSPAPSQASSEEESVAGMGYMSEGSNLSVKDCPPAASNHVEENNIPDTTFMPAPRRLPEHVAHFIPRRQTTTAATISASCVPRSSPAGESSFALSSLAGTPGATSTNSNLHCRCGVAGSSVLESSPAHTASASCTHHSRAMEEHRPFMLPKFREPQANMWTASHAANLPTEDRSSSLVNLLLQPLPPNFDSETQLLPLEPDYKTLIRVNLWSVIDGHGGGAVATYASEVLLPHIAASVSRALDCAIVDRGLCTVNGQLRDANAMDLDGLIKTSDRAMGNPNSIHYRSPYEGTDSEGEEGAEAAPTVVERKQIASLRDAKAKFDAGNLAGSGSEATVDGRFDGSATVVGSSSCTVDGRLLRTPDGDRHDHPDRPTTPNQSVSGSVVDASVSSVKTSVKTAASPATREALPGTHSPHEVAAISRAITESFLAVDEGWINSIDKVATAQTSCQSNGRWNSGACALVVFTIQRLDWTSVSEPDREKEFLGPGHSKRNTSQNRDAARRRMLDYAARTKSASSMSTASSTSSLTTEEAVNASGLESEITETEGEEDDRSHDNETRKRVPLGSSKPDRRVKDESLISPPGCCSCHCYRAHDAMLYTAHVGDCRAVLLGSAPPRTIKVRDPHHPDTTDDESSHHSSDETECLSSSDHDADSSEDEDVEVTKSDSNNANANNPSSPTATPTTAAYMNFPRRVVRQKSSRRRAQDHFQGPYNPLPPLVLKDDPDQQNIKTSFDIDTDIAARRASSGKEPSDSSTSSQDSDDPPPLIHLLPFTRPIDLTTDHSAYNPAEVTAVLRRCNNAPRAISAGVGGGIKRVAGSLAVTRALGDAYLKTPELSFLPYKRHAPYITARPEVNCRPLVKDVDKVLILATDGVWERASGEDVLRWVRNFYEERIAEAERRSNRRNQVVETSKAVAAPLSVEEIETAAKNSQDGAECDLFEQRISEPESNNRKRDLAGSPSPPAKRRKRSRHNRVTYNVADVIVRRVLNKVRRARNISSLQALMSLPQGRARRSKHDDITSSVVDLSAFVA